MLEFGNGCMRIITDQYYFRRTAPVPVKASGSYPSRHIPRANDRTGNGKWDATDTLSCKCRVQRSSATASACESRKARVREQRGPHLINDEKNIITRRLKTKLNSDCTIKFVSINTSKQDFTWIYLDKVISGLQVDRGQYRGWMDAGKLYILWWLEWNIPFKGWI
jgi:hypothetical protein